MCATPQPRSGDRKQRRCGTRLHGAVMCLSAAVMFFFTGQATASSVGIHLLKAAYTTDLSVEATGYSTTSAKASRKITSVNPVSDELTAIERVTAEAEASTFLVSANTVASPVASGIRYPYAKAMAQTVLNFQPLQDAPLPLAFEFDGSGLAAAYSSGFVSLIDLNTDEPLFLYSWTSGVRDSNIPWKSGREGNCQLCASLKPAPELLASHEYALTMQVSTNANNDGMNMRIDLSGVHPVPEADIASLMLLGMGLVAGVIRRRTRTCRR